MSKAFLRESDFDPDPVVAAPVSTLPAGTPNYMTAPGLDRLRQELRRLKTIERPALALQSAVDAEAKARLLALDQRIRALQQSSLTAEVVAMPAGKTEVVRFGTTVTLRDASGIATEYRLVGVDEAEPGTGAISWLSPLAQALMNRRLGESVEIATPAGKQSVSIAGIAYQ